jgi:hypothetical protein
MLVFEGNISPVTWLVTVSDLSISGQDLQVGLKHAFLFLVGLCRFRQLVVVFISMVMLSSKFSFILFKFLFEELSVGFLRRKSIIFGWNHVFSFVTSWFVAGN